MLVSVVASAWGSYVFSKTPQGLGVLMLFAAVCGGCCVAAVCCGCVPCGPGSTPQPIGNQVLRSLMGNAQQSGGRSAAKYRHAAGEYSPARRDHPLMSISEMRPFRSRELIIMRRSVTRLRRSRKASDVSSGTATDPQLALGFALILALALALALVLALALALPLATPHGTHGAQARPRLSPRGSPTWVAQNRTKPNSR